MTTPIVIAGAGGMGREAHTWLGDIGELEQVVGFVAAPDTPPDTWLLDLPVWADLDTPRRAHGPLRVVMGVGSPKVKARVAQQADAQGCALMTVVHPLAYIGPDVDLAPGVVVGPYAIVPRDNRIGTAALVYYNSVVGHDATVGAYSYVAPGVVLGGHSSIGTGVYVGLNASVLPTLTVGDRVVIGANAAVVRDVPDDTTVVGVPARPIDPAGRKA